MSFRSKAPHAYRCKCCNCRPQSCCCHCGRAASHNWFRWDVKNQTFLLCPVFCGQMLPCQSRHLQASAAYHPSSYHIRHIRNLHPNNGPSAEENHSHTHCGCLLHPSHDNHPWQRNRLWQFHAANCPRLHMQSGEKISYTRIQKPVTLPHISLRSKSYEISCPSNRFLQCKYTLFVSKCNVFLSSNENLTFHSSYSETIAYNTLTGAILKI